MTAISIARAGGPEVLQPATRPVPQPGAGEVLIKVAFAGINRHDCGQRRRGFGPPGATDIPALKIEIARQVVDRVWPHLGSRVTPIIDSVMPLARVSDAHARMESSVHIGKILLEVAH